MTISPPEPRLVMHPLTPRMAEVLRVERLSPRMVRVTLTGASLDGFINVAPDDHVKLVFPEPGEERPRLPEVGPNGMRLVPGQPRPTFRDYTPRRYDAYARELDIDFVLHGHGPASTWAQHARPGDPIGVLGPRGSHLVPGGYDWYLIAGDETALPAVGRWLESLPAATRATVFVEVADAAEEQPLESPAEVNVRWLHRGPAEAGTTQLLEDAVRGFQLPDGTGFVWVAGEAGSLRPIRRYLTREIGLPKSQVMVDGYWKRGTVNHDHHEDDA